MAVDLTLVAFRKGGRAAWHLHLLGQLDTPPSLTTAGIRRIPKPARFTPQNSQGRMADPSRNGL